MALTRMVDGEVVLMSDAESATIQKEWQDNEAQKHARRLALSKPCVWVAYETHITCGGEEADATFFGAWHDVHEAIADLIERFSLTGFRLDQQQVEEGEIHMVYCILKRVGVS